MQQVSLLSQQQGLHAFATAGFVKLNCAKQIVQVRNRQRWLAVFGGCRHDIVNTAGGIDDRTLGVKAQMYKHRQIVGKRGGF